MDTLIWFTMPLLAWFVGLLVLDFNSIKRFFK